MTPTLRDTIRAAVAASGLSQREIAARAGMHQPSLNDYLTGKSDLNGATLDRLLAALGVRFRAGKPPPR